MDPLSNLSGDSLQPLLLRNLLGIAVLLFDRALRCLVVEGDLARQLGYDTENMIGKTLEEAGFQERGEYLRPLLEAAFEGHESIYERSILANSYKTRVAPMRNTDGTIIGAMLTATDITELKQTQHNLFDSETQFRLIFENSMDAVLLTLPNGSILMANLAACAMLGWTELELQQMDRANVVDTTDPNLATMLEERSTTGAARGQLRFKRKDGTLITTEISSRLFVGASGVTMTSMILRDITERLYTEAMLKASETRFRQLFTNSDHGIILQGPQAEVLLSNDVAPDMLGLTADQLSGKSSFDPSWNVVHGDGSPFPGPMHPVPQAIAMKRPVTNVVMGVYRPARQDRVWLLVNATPWLNDAGYVEEVLCTFTDITEMKKAEQALAESEARNRALISAIPDTIGIVNRSGFVREYITGSDHSTTVPSSRVIGSPLSEIFPPDQAPEFIEKVNRVFEENIDQYLDFSYDVGGKVFSRAFHITQYNDDEVLILMRDVTEKRKAEKQAMQLTIERERVKLLHGFIGIVTHDFRTLLAVISSSAYLLSKAESADMATEHLERIDEYIDHINTAVSEMLRVVELDSGVTFKQAPTDVNSLLQQVIEALTISMHRKALELETMLDPTLPVMLGDAGELTQALMKIAENAVRYTLPSGNIRIQTRCIDGELHIDIKDTGIGISPEALPHIFDALYRSDEARSISDGTFGLGLAIADRIIRGHGGRIAVESTVRQGSLFRVILPVCLS